MGDKERALEWLEEANTEDRSWMVWIKVDPVMDRSVPIRGFRSYWQYEVPITAARRNLSKPSPHFWSCQIGNVKSGTVEETKEVQTSQRYALSVNISGPVEFSRGGRFREMPGCGTCARCCQMDAIAPKDGPPIVLEGECIGLWTVCEHLSVGGYDAALERRQASRRKRPWLFTQRNHAPLGVARQSGAKTLLAGGFDGYGNSFGQVQDLDRP